MTSCSIYVGNRKFETETELNEFLLVNSEYIKKYGRDIVFSLTTKQNTVRDVIIQKGEIANKKFKEHAERQSLENVDLDGIVASGDYIGVTAFLQGLKVNGQLLFPEMIRDNYFETRKKDWLDGNFTVEEKKLLFGESNTRPPQDAAEMQKWREQIEDQWHNQGLIGTEIHKVGQLYFQLEASKRHQDLKDVVALIEPAIDKELIPDLETTVSYFAKLEESLNQELNPSGKFDLLFYPEYKISGTASEINDPNKTNNLLGIIDLLVVDPNGHSHIIDYKVSPHDYAMKDVADGYSSAKILTFKYQLAVYERILKSYGIYTGGTKLMVAPIQLMNFRKENDKWTYDTIKEYEGMTDTISKDGMERINDNLDEIFYEPETINIAAENLLDSTAKDMSELFPNIRFSVKTEEIEDMVQKSFAKNARQDKDSGLWIYTWSSTGREMKAKTEEELYSKVLAEYKKFPTRRLENVRRIKSTILEAQQDPENTNYSVNFVGKYDSPKDQENGISSWLNVIMKEYINPGWRLIDDNWTIPFEHLGMIIFERGNQIDVVKLSSSNLKGEREIIKGRKFITGKFEKDNIVSNIPDFIPLQCNYGNMELMEAMCALNKVPELFKDKMLGEIKVINTHTQSAISTSNKQLVDNFNFLAKRAKFNRNYFEEGVIKTASYANLAYNKVFDIITDNKGGLKRAGYQDINTTISAMDNFTTWNPEKIRAQLVILKNQFEQAFPDLQQVTKDKTKLGEDRVKAYNYILQAIAETDGIHYGQILNDHSNYLDWNGLTGGLHGLRVDNPGNTASPFLNSLTKLIMNAHQNSRQQLTESISDIRKLVQALKDAKSFSYLKERTIGNQADLYKNLYDFRDGDIYFKNPWTDRTLLKEERDLLIYVLDKLNARKYAGKTKAFIESQKADSNSEYYWVPLAKGDTASMVSTDGFLKTMRYKFRSLLGGYAQRESDSREGVGTNTVQSTDTAKGVAEKLLGGIEKLLQKPRNKKEDQANLEVWEMTNRFDAGYSHHRKEIIQTRGKGYFNYNLETLFLQHEFAYIQKENIDKIFPDLKAASIFLNFSSFLQNTNFTNIAKYLHDYVNQKVLNKSAVASEYESLEAVRKTLMGMTSKLALAFSPIQWYQHLEGIWKDASLFFRKPDGTDAFTFQNLKDSWLSAYSDMFHYGNGQSKAELINELYALNDMDVNSYVRRITSDKNGFWHFWSSLAFRFSSRPDFYNRMTIFGAQMRNDGSWNAYSVKDGKLIYDWKKDKRFDAFANGRKTDPRYKQQEGLYYAMAKQMIAEGTKMLDENGKYVDFKLSGDPDKPTPLPKAYTTQQSEGYKDLADMMYGYYSDEKKSLVQSYGIGAMFMQMYTYVSGKKNQYFAQSRQSIMGKMQQLEENGQKYWLKIDEKGNLTNEPTTDPASGVPFIVWKGQFHEGIITTLAKMAQEVLAPNENGKRDPIEGFRRYKEDFLNSKDLDERRAYISNYKQLGYDLGMWIIVGSLLTGSIVSTSQEYMKEQGNDTMDKAVANTAIAFSTNLLKHSLLDFNFVDSIFGRGLDWTPFALETSARTIKYFGQCMTGDETFLRTLAKSAAATRTFKPMWDYYLPKVEKEEE